MSRVFNIASFHRGKLTVDACARDNLHWWWFIDLVITQFRATNIEIWETKASGLDYSRSTRNVEHHVDSWLSYHAHTWRCSVDSMRQKPAPPLSCSSRFVQLRVFWTGLCTQTEYDTTNNISLCQLWRENGRMIIYNIKFPSLENIRGIFDYEDNRISSKNHAVIFFIVIVQLFWNPEVFSLSAVPG